MNWCQKKIKETSQFLVLNDQDTRKTSWRCKLNKWIWPCVLNNLEHLFPTRYFYTVDSENMIAVNEKHHEGVICKVNYNISGLKRS